MLVHVPPHKGANCRPAARERILMPVTYHRDGRTWLTLRILTCNGQNKPARRDAATRLLVAGMATDLDTRNQTEAGAVGGHRAVPQRRRRHGVCQWHWRVPRLSLNSPSARQHSRDTPRATPGNSSEDPAQTGRPPRCFHSIAAVQPQTRPVDPGLTQVGTQFSPH